jgi:small conductance mechanosensitive channel
MDINKVIDQLVEFGTTYGLKIIGAILILIIGRIAAGIVRRIVRRLLERAKVDTSIVSFFSSFSYILILLLVVLAALATFGVQTASFVAILGAAAFAVGFALQGSLSNFAAGVMILLFRPYKVDDYIEAAGVAGTVKEIYIFNTILATLDNIKIIVPNSKVYGDIIKNVWAYDTRRVDMEFGISYSSSIQKAIEIIMSLVKEDERILSDPATQIEVMELADSSVNFVVRPWVRSEDYWPVFFDLTRNVKENFDKNGIEIPFPQRVVHMAKDS